MNYLCIIISSEELYIVKCFIKFIKKLLCIFFFSERIYKVFRGRFLLNDIVFFFGIIGMFLVYIRILYFMIVYYDYWTVSVIV